MIRLLLACLLLAGGLAEAGEAAASVAVIGGGVAGASASYYIRRSLGAGASVTVFERSSRAGGRAEELTYEGNTIELGASIAWHNNRLVRDLADAAGLEREEPPGAGGLTAVYDGRELVFQESPWRLLTVIRLLWRYWLSWWMLRAAPARAFDKFQGIYALLDSGTAFERPDALLKAVGLYEYTQASVFEFLRESYGTDVDLVARELVGAVQRCNNGQTNLQVNSLAGLVSLLPVTDPRVFRLRGGNGQLSPAVLRAANATVHLSAAVTAVRRQQDGRYMLEVGAQAQGPFDTVVLATPLEGSGGLRVEGVALPPIPARKYQQTVTTIVKGEVRPSLFGLSEMSFSSVLVTEDAGVPWNSLGLVGRVAGARNASLWKLFSREPLPHAWTEMMFERGYEVVAVRVWDSPGSVPRFDAPEDFAPFKLAEGLFYTAGKRLHRQQALENAASAMEMAAIEGRMAALLVTQHLRARAAAAQQPAAVQQQHGGVLAQPGGAEPGVAAAA